MLVVMVALLTLLDLERLLDIIYLILAETTLEHMQDFSQVLELIPEIMPVILVERIMEHILDFSQVPERIPEIMQVQEIMQEVMLQTSRLHHLLLRDFMQVLVLRIQASMQEA